MPTYEYECQRCGYTFELFQSIKDPPRKTCPECRGQVRRLLGTGAGLLFKGSGFYATDYRSTGYKESARKEAGASESKSDSTSGKDASASGSGASKAKE